MRASWIAVHAALAIVALRVWNMLLLKEHLDRPVVVAAWLGGGFALFLAARGIARLTPEPQRGRLQRGYAAIEGPELSLVALLFVLLFLFHWGFARAASDGREYFIQVRSLIIDGDLDLSNENAAFGVRGTAGNFAFGAPLLWAPFFILAHLWLGLLNLLGGDYPRNGFFNPYQRAVGLGSLVYGYAALVMIYRLLSQYFSRRLSAASTIAITGGSFIVWYLVADNSMSHGASMFAVTLFIYMWHQTRGDRSVKRWALLGAAAGLMSMVRWQNLLFVVFPAVEEVGYLIARARGAGASIAGPEQRTSRPDSGAEPIIGAGGGDASWMRVAAARYVAFAATFLIVFSPQLVFWKAVRGSWFSPPTGAHGAEFAAPAIGDVLFSADRGLFSWTPLLLVAVLGLIPFTRRHRQFGSLMIAALALQVYINATVEWSGHGFGARRFAGCALIFAVGLAALLHWMRQRPALAPAVLVGVLVVTNVFFMAGMRSGDIPPTGTVRFENMVGATTARVGNPFALPMSALTALRFGADLGFYERIGAQTFNNLRIDVGGDNDHRFLLRGWSGAEAGADFTFRWSDGPESTLVVPLKEAADYRLELRCAPFLPAGSERQVVAVWINDELVERVAITPGMQTYRVAVPAAVLRPRFNEIRLQYAWTASPRSVGASNDDRELALQCTGISLIREG